MSIEHIIELPGLPLGGASGVQHFRILFAGKTSSERFPYVIFNEKIAGEIGRMLGLPCPEVLIKQFSGRYYFFSHWQETSDSGTTLPPGSAPALLAYLRTNPEFIHGMIVFDLFVANNDRRRENLLLRSDGHIALIDQGNALLYFNREGISSGTDRLKAIESDFGALFDRPYEYLALLTDESLVRFWCERIRAIPDFFIECLVQNLPNLEYIDSEMREKTVEFLKARRGVIFEQIMEHRDLFPNLKGG